MSVSLERLVRNQFVFRELNERLRRLTTSLGAPLQFLCECSRVDCVTVLQLGLGDYERARSSPIVFVTAPGHELPEVERVIEANEDFSLVEKTDWAELAASTDPRRNGR